MRLPDSFVRHIREGDYNLRDKKVLDRGKGDDLYKEMCLSVEED